MSYFMEKFINKQCEILRIEKPVIIWDEYQEPEYHLFRVPEDTTPNTYFVVACDLRGIWQEDKYFKNEYERLVDRIAWGVITMIGEYDMKPLLSDIRADDRAKVEARVDEIRAKNIV